MNIKRPVFTFSSNSHGAGKWIALLVLLTLVLIDIGSSLRPIGAASHTAGAVCTWNGTTGDWSDASRWSCGSVPGMADTAIIGIGEVTVSSDTTVGVVQLTAGTLRCNANLTVNDSMSWTAGTINGSATGMLTSNGALDMTSSSQKILSGATLVNNGSAHWLGGQFVLQSVFDNRAGATFEVQAELLSAEGGSVRNAGTITKSAVTTTRFVNVSFNNCGIVNINEGILDLQTVSHTSSGPLNVASGATLILEGFGTHSIEPAGRINGQGALKFAGGGTRSINGTFNLTGNVSIDPGPQVNFNTGTDISTLSFSGGTISGSAPVTILNSMDWSGGDIARSGSFTIQSNAILNISGVDNRFKNLNSPLINKGVANYQGSHLFLASVFDNRPGAHFNIQTDQPVLDNSGSIENAGTLTKNGGGASFIRCPLNNSGTLEIISTSLIFESAVGPTLTVNQSGGVTRLNNGTLGANLSINGGSLEGTGSVLGNVTNSGIISPGLVTGTPGTITIGKDYVQTAAGRLDIELGGTTPGISSDLLIANTQTSTNTTLGGTLNVSLISGFRPASAATFQIVRYQSHSGTFATTNGLDLGGGQVLAPDYRTSEVVLTSGDGGEGVPWVQIVAVPQETRVFLAPGARPPANDALRARGANSIATGPRYSFEYTLTVGNSGARTVPAIVIVEVPPAGPGVPVPHDLIEDSISNDPIVPVTDPADRQLFREIPKRVVKADGTVLIPFVIVLPPHSSFFFHGGFETAISTSAAGDFVSSSRLHTLAGAGCPGSPEPKAKAYGNTLHAPSGECVKNVLDLLLGLVPGGECADLLKDVVKNFLLGAGTSALTGTPLSLTSTLASFALEVAKCVSDFFPAAKAIKIALELTEFASKVNDIYGVYDSCAGSILPNPLAPEFSSEDSTKCVSSVDPNDKVGPDGVGSERFFTGGESLRYAVFFENLPEATAPAQIVSIRDQLDPSLLNFNTFALGPISFAGKSVTPPPNASSFTEDVDMRPDKNLLVRVNANLDKTTGLLTWTLTSIDPATGQPLPPTSVDGFLNPDVTPPEGAGSVFFVVDPKTALPSGTVIRNRATIVFDQNSPLDTPEWFNTIDNAKPASQVSPLSSTQCSSFRVSWSGSDATSGIAHYSIFVSKDDGPFEPWRLNTTQTSDFFNGMAGSKYAFYSVARDGAGNVEDPPAQPDTSATVTTAMSISPGSQSFTAQGGTGAVNVLAEGGCNWVAISRSFFISVTTGGSGSGNGAVTYLVDPNPTNEARQGAIVIAGQRFIVNQEAGPASTNRLPLAVDDTVTTNQNTPLNITVLSNDSDPDGDTLTISGVTPASHGNLVMNAASTVTYSPASAFVGSDSFTYSISDGHGGTATAAVVVNVRVTDLQAPVISSTLSLSQLWPPNHDLVNIGLTASAFDNQDGVRPVEIQIFGNEDDQEPTGDETYSPDAKDIAPNTLRLRSERKPDADGRVYLIVVRALDSSGNVGVSCHTVTIPKSRSDKDLVAVEKQAAAARAYCQANGGTPPPGYFRIGDGPLIGIHQ